MADKLEVERVNSFHHQALKKLADGLKVVATAPDGIIEAVEGTNENGMFILGVQFHPEMMSTSDENAKRLFTAFVKATQENVTK